MVGELYPWNKLLPVQNHQYERFGRSSQIMQVSCHQSILVDTRLRIDQALSPQSKYQWFAMILLRALLPLCLHRKQYPASSGLLRNPVVVVGLQPARLCGK